MGTEVAGAGAGDADAGGDFGVGVVEIDVDQGRSSRQDRRLGRAGIRGRERVDAVHAGVGGAGARRIADALEGAVGEGLVGRHPAQEARPDGPHLAVRGNAETVGHAGIGIGADAVLTEYLDADDGGQADDHDAEGEEKKLLLTHGGASRLEAWFC